jgi:hypothetical protein
MASGRAGAYHQAMWPWSKKPEKPLREQLIEARANVQRQLDVMAAGPIRGFEYQPASIEGLENELREIDEALSQLGSTDA